MTDHPPLPDPDPASDLDLDLLRGWAAGTLSQVERQALEAHLARDPEAARLAEQMRAVEHLAQHLRGEVPASRLKFDDLRLDEAPEAIAPSAPALPRRGWRWVAAAAAALLVAGAVWFGARQGEPVAPARVSLLAISLTGEEPTWPAPLTAGFRPVRAGEIAWFDNAEAAARLARFTRRRVFYYVHYDGCPLCRDLEAGALRDKAVLAQLERLVPLRVNAAGLPQDEVARLMATGWPHLAVREAEGRVVAELPGVRPGAELARELGRALDAAPAPESWEASEGRASRIAATLYARRALLAARDSAATAPDAARRELASTSKSLAGTPAGDDLSRVLAGWPDGAPFPVLEEPPR